MVHSPVWIQGADVLSWADDSMNVDLLSHKDLPPAQRLDWLFCHDGDVARARSSDGYLFPLGINSSAHHIVAYEIRAVAESHVAMAVLCSNKRLVVFRRSLTHWSVGLSVTVELLTSACSVHWWVSADPGSSSSSLFVFDRGSCRVCELRFDSFGVHDDFCILYWFLESGLPISASSDISLVESDTDLPSIQIIGRQSNADSQGLVRLVNASGIPGSPTNCSCPRAAYIACAGPESLVVNVPGRHGYLKVFSPYSCGFDFPLSTRRGADIVQVVNFPTSWYIGVVSNGGLEIYPGDDLWNPLGVFDPAGVLSGIKMVNISAAPENVPKGMFLTIHRGDSEIVYAHMRLDENQVSVVGRARPHGLVTCVQDALWSDNDGLKRVTNAVSSEDGEHEDNTVLVLALPDIVEFVADSEWLIVRQGSASSFLYCYPIYVDGELGVPIVVELPPFCLVQNISPKVSLKLVSFGGRRVIQGLPGGVLLAQDVDDTQGVFWRPVTVSGTFGALAGTCMSPDFTEVFYIEASSTRVASTHIEGAVIGTKTRLEAEDPVVVYRREVDPGTVGGPGDFASRRYYLRPAPTMEELAWLYLSDAPLDSFILSQPVSWVTLRAAGVGYIPLESASVQTLAEHLHKSALQEYLRTKDPQVLEDKVAFHLALLGKQQLLVSLFKQHGMSCASPKHSKIAIFLSEDLRGEAVEKGIKNAFELVRQKRYFFAVAVFLLAGQLRDALDITCRQIGDIQLALFMTQVMAFDPVDLWEAKILPLSQNNLWFSLMYYGGIKGDIMKCADLIQLPSERSNHDPAKEPFPASLGPFKSPNVFVSRLSATEFVAALAIRLKRLRRLPAEWDANLVAPLSPPQRRSMYADAGIAID